MGIGLSAQGVNMNRLPGKMYFCHWSHCTFIASNTSAMSYFQVVSTL